MKALILSPRKELAQQNYSKLAYKSKSIFCAGSTKHSDNLDADYIFASLQTAYSRLAELEKYKWDKLIIDEVHYSSSEEATMLTTLIKSLKGFATPHLVAMPTGAGKSLIIAGICDDKQHNFRPYQLHTLEKIRECNPKVIGLTATPYNGAGEPLQGWTCITTVNINTLIRDKYLTPIRGFSFNLGQWDNMEDVKTVDYTEEMHEIVLGKRITYIQKQVQSFIDKYKYKKILIFCGSVSLGKQYNTPLKIFGDTPADERDSVIEQFKTSGGVLINCGVLTTGFDAPDIDCIILLRATKSLQLYTQILGRGMRVSKDKKTCDVYDFGGNFARFPNINTLTPHSIRNWRASRQEALDKSYCEANGLLARIICKPLRAYENDEWIPVKQIHITEKWSPRGKQCLKFRFIGEGHTTVLEEWLPTLHIVTKNHLKRFYNTILTDEMFDNKHYLSDEMLKKVASDVKNHLIEHPIGAIVIESSGSYKHLKKVLSEPEEIH